MADPEKPAPAPPPPPPVFVPSVRWRLSAYLACVPPGGRHGHLSLDEVRELVPWSWGLSPRVRLREAGIGYSTRNPHLRGDSPIWVRRADEAEVALGELVRAEITRAAWAGPRRVSSGDLSWHLPPAYTGSGVLRRWRPSKPGDKPEVQRTIRGAHWAPGEELVLQTGTSPEEVSRLVRAWVKGWAPTG